MGIHFAEPRGTVQAELGTRCLSRAPGTQNSLKSKSFSGKFFSQLCRLLISSRLNNPQELLVLICLGTDIYSFFADAPLSLCRRRQCLAGDGVIAVLGGDELRGPQDT